MDYKQLAKEVSVAGLVGVGESTHGTHEFFVVKRKLFTELVVNYGFNTFMLEERSVVCQRLNQYIKTGSGNLEQIMSKLYPIWQVDELKELLIQFREDYPKYSIEFIGYDIDQTKENLNHRDELMAQNIINYKKLNPHCKAMVWAHNTHIKKSSEDKTFKPMGMFLHNAFQENYVAIAQLFGAGKFSAAHIDENEPDSKDRTLKSVAIDTISPDILESRFNLLYLQPYYIQKSEIYSQGLNVKGEIRSIGWGVLPKRAQEYTEQCNLLQEFDLVIYFPKATNTRPL